MVCYGYKTSACNKTDRCLHVLTDAFLVNNIRTPGIYMQGASYQNILVQNEQVCC